MQSQKRKRREEKSKTRKKNPLAVARKQSDKHLQVWFRRIGGGYALFTQYYLKQPESYLLWNNGEIDDRDTSIDAAVTEEAILLSSLAPSAGVGMSRAAQKRRRKKNKGDINSKQVNQSQMSTSFRERSGKNSVTESAPLVHRTPLEKDRLVQKAIRHALSRSHGPSGDDKHYTHIYNTMLQYAMSPLPVTFRLRKSLSAIRMQEIQEQIQQKFPFLRVLPFNDNIYQLPKSSKDTLKKKYPELNNFLFENSQNGSIARQDIGSILPVLALEEGNHIHSQKTKQNQGRVVFDLCASPGNKTMQMLEVFLKKAQEQPTDNADKYDFRILANDVNESRLQALREAIQRSGICRAGEKVPVEYSCQDARQVQTTRKAHVIVCDVPCSGDGTVRKDPHILESWQPSQGNSLHALQFQILLHAVTELLRTNGVICYSTCSLNPVENEAVVAAVLNAVNSKKELYPSNKPNSTALELLEFPVMPGFRRRPGISNWYVADYQVDRERPSSGPGDEDDEIPELNWYMSYEDAVKGGMSHAVPTLWPGTGETQVGSMQSVLTRCTRLWPQDYDTGGFFLALLRKNF